MELLTVPQVCERLKLGRATVYRLIARGDIKSITIGKSRRISVDALDAFITSRG